MEENFTNSPCLRCSSDRICAITIDLDRVTLLVIGVYLPTSDCTLDIYNDHLIEVEALIKNHPDCCVIIGGDFNAHVAVAGNLKGNSSQNSHGNLLSNMVCRNDLFFSSLSSNASGPCYTYFSGDTRTTTDYFIVDACLAQFIQKILCLISSQFFRSLTTHDVFIHLPFNKSQSFTYISTVKLEARLH